MIILYNGRIGFPHQGKRLPTSIAIENRHIIAIGSDEQVMSLSQPRTNLINLHGKTVWPGLIDSHLHLELLSNYLDSIHCETETMQEVLTRVAEKSKSSKPATWLTGYGWNQNSWDGIFGTARELDSVSDDHPVYLNDKALHTAWVNSAALKLAGIDKSTPDPEGGAIQRDSTGEPTGILFESAVRLVEKVVPPKTLQTRQALFFEAQNYLIKLGITAVNDFDSLSSYETLQTVAAQGKLRLRVIKGIPKEKLDWAIEQNIKTRQGNEFLKWGWLKLFADGALGPHTAAMLQPYSDDINNYGKLLLTQDEILAIGEKTSTHGISLAIHAIGDHATQEVLKGFQKLREYEQKNQIHRLPHRVEHLQLLNSDNIKRTAELEITASMQPIHATSDRYTADKYWGARARYAYAFNSLFKCYTNLIFGSDAPVESPNPFWGIHAAVTRCRQGQNSSTESWFPQERISLHNAVKAYSETPATLFEFNTGKLVEGKLADLMILSVDPFTVEPDELFSITPDAVMINGEWQFSNIDL